VTVHHRGRLAHAAGDPAVTISDFKFAPATITITVGDTITWSNNGPSPHTATANDHRFDTGTLNKGQSASHTFNTAGTFAYICTIHPFMHGTVVVQGSSSSGSSGSGSSSASGSSGSSGSGASTGSSGSTGSTGTGTATATQAATTPSGLSLPVTGLNLAAVVLVAIGLLGVGLGLRRRSRT
jgi:plastocyanin